MRYEAKGIHIPPFLISSITTNCNLYCTGCYARANHMCEDRKPQEMLSSARWAEIFSEADKLGISFILLAGGEPLLYREVILKAAAVHTIIFPIFTNGTLLDEAYIHLFHANRNLVPVISLEGNEERTDCRRGAGTYGKIEDTMGRLKNGKILYGVSLTVTSDNLGEVTSSGFIAKLHDGGCGIVFFIEYVPVADGTDHLSLDEMERICLEKRQNDLRKEYRDILFLSFPGDEKYTGGCLAAGRGFFHINPHGGVEPCPFSPYSDTDMKSGSLLSALQSPLFAKIKQGNLLEGEHEGGCSLFAHEEKIRQWTDEKAITNNEK